MIRSEWSRRYKSGETALDLVRNLAYSLSKYKGEPLGVDSPTMARYGLTHRRRNNSYSIPKEPRETTKFLSQFSKGTYQHWLTSADIDEKMEEYRSNLDKVKKDEEKLIASKGLAEKNEAIREAITQLEKVEAALLKKGAKTFRDLHPTIEAMAKSDDIGTGDIFDADYNLEFGFSGVKDLTNDRKEAYLHLYVCSRTFPRVKRLNLFIALKQPGLVIWKRSSRSHWRLGASTQRSRP